MSVLPFCVASLFSVAFFALALCKKNLVQRAPSGIVVSSKQAQKKHLQSQIVQAGFYHANAVELFQLCRLAFLFVSIAATAIAFSVYGASLNSILISCGLVAMGVFGPSVWLQRTIEQRQKRTAETLPDVLELTAVCLEAGLGFQQALERVVAGSQKEDLLRQQLAWMLAELRMGIPFDRALRRFAERTGGAEIETMTAILTQASGLGAKVSDLLRRHAGAMREKRLLALEEVAGTANAKLALPLSICLLPAGLIFLIGPAVLGLLKIF